MGKASPLFKYSTLALAVSLSTASIAAEEEQSGGAEDLEVIVVSGSKVAKPLKDVAGSISVITEEDLEKQAITDINQLFKYDPSIKITGSVGGAQNFVVRGMGSDRVLMIKDGMRMNEGYGANGLNDIVGRGFIDTDTLKQVEVAKGAASSLYGSDALGGIVVFTTKDASDYLANGESFAGNVKVAHNGASDQNSIGATLALMTGEVEHLLSFGRRDGEEQQNFKETKSPFSIESSSLLYKAKLNLTEKSSVNFTADVWKQESTGDSADGLLFYFRGLADYGYQIVAENTITDKENSSFKLNYKSEDATALYDLVDVSVYRNNTEQSEEEYGQLDINAAMFGVVELRDMWKTATYEQNTQGLISHASKKLNDNHTIGYGIDIETSESSRIVKENREVAGVAKDGYPKDTNKFPTTDVSRTGVFINDEITLLDGKLTLTPGARFDNYDMDANGALNTKGEAFKSMDESHVSLNFGSLYRITDSVSGYFQYGQGFKVPAYDLAYIEHYNNFGSYIYEVVPSDDLNPEESDTFEIGLKGHLGQEGNIAFNVAAYYNKYDNFLATALLNSEMFFDDEGNFSHVYDTFQYQNLDEVTIKGAELGVTYYPVDAISLYANVSVQDGKDNKTDEYIRSISPTSGNVGIAFDAENWSTELILGWARRMTKVNEGNAEIAGYGVLDWQLSYDVNEQMKLNLVVNNLLDKEYLEYSNVAGHASDKDLSFYAESGRNINATLKYMF